MKVTILDTHTGETRISEDHDIHWWTDGNGVCDCNRETLFGYDTENGNTCIGAHRYLIIAAEIREDDGVVSAPTLRELNADYPEELLEKHFPMNPDHMFKFTDRGIEFISTLHSFLRLPHYLG